MAYHYPYKTRSRVTPDISPAELADRQARFEAKQLEIQKRVGGPRVEQQQNEMLRNLGERIMGILGQGREQFYKMDDAYANAVASRIPAGQETAMLMSGRGLQGLTDAGAIAGNIASRYALPAGGLTAAGIGLADLTAGFGEITDPQQTMQQLPMY